MHKNFLQPNIMYTVYFCMCAILHAASYLQTLAAYCLISAARSSVVLFLNSTMPVTPTRWQFITKLVDRCVDLTRPLCHDPIRCSINVQELIQRVALQDVSSKLSLSYISFSSILNISIVAVPTVLVCTKYDQYLIFMAGYTHKN